MLTDTLPYMCLLIIPAVERIRGAWRGALWAAVLLAVGMATSIIAVHYKRTAASKAGLTEEGNGAYGLYIHFGSATFANPGEKGTIPASRFAPASLNVQSWAHEAKQAGMTFAVLTAKHESGFCLWDSRLTDYKAPNTPAGRGTGRPSTSPRQFRAWSQPTPSRSRLSSHACAPMPSGSSFAKPTRMPFLPSSAVRPGLPAASR